MSIFTQNKWTLPKLHDPWQQAEQWRYEHPAVAVKYQWRRILPGAGEWAWNTYGGGGAGSGHGHGSKKHH